MTTGDQAPLPRPAATAPGWRRDAFPGRSSRVGRWWDREVVRRLGLSALIRHTGNFADVTWLGRPIWQNVADIWAVQEALSNDDIDVVVECGTNEGGSAFFMASVFDMLGRGKVITIDLVPQVSFEHPRIEFVVGSSTAPDVVAHVKRRVGELGAQRVLVILDSDHSEPHVAAELRAYADLVPVGGHLIVQDGVIDQLPMLKSGRPGPLAAVRKFVADDPRFEVDEARSSRFLYNFSPSGWLRRVR